MKKYKIVVKTLQGKIITFTVSKYSNVDGRIIFTDEYTNIPKNFDGRNCEIVEVLE
ncbi:MAG TPA: hypothetical protein VJ907_02505 [Halanaerobiales bacterium]|nr:hypothetical protein [Halanaerobiales bacterium]